MKRAQAESISEIYKFTCPDPLMTCREVDEYYCDRVNSVRGSDLVARLSTNYLKCRNDGTFCKYFLTGHPGVGKSTEITRLACRLEKELSFFRFSIRNELDQGSFQPFDILLFAAMSIIERTALPKIDGGAGKRPDKSLLCRLQEWFDTEERTFSESSSKSGEVGAGVGLGDDSLWKSLLGIFASTKGEMKYAHSRDTKRVEYRLKRLAPLVELVNSVMDECNRLMRKECNKEWVIVGEDFEKIGDRVLIESLFINNGAILKDWRIHQLFTIPIQLICSSKEILLPYEWKNIPDIPVYTKEHKPHSNGRQSIENLLTRRIDPGLFEEHQIERLIVASGGNIRDLFDMARSSADLAIQRDRSSEKIVSEDVDGAIREMRVKYLRRLGTSEYDEDTLTFEAKAAKLMAIYNCEPGSQIPDTALHSLLRSKAVQEFNGECWFGVHPLVVDILNSQGGFGSAASPLPGGTI